MAKRKKRVKDLPAERANRAKCTTEESLKRVQEFAKRKEHLVATVRKGTDRGESA
jgi:hypothetical protein